MLHSSVYSLAASGNAVNNVRLTFDGMSWESRPKIWRYAAIMVPQNISRRQPFVEILTDNVSYLLEGRLNFKSGVEHSLNVTLTSDPSKAKIDIGGEVTSWN